MELMFDGWYSFKEDAKGVLDFVESLGATPVGLVEGKRGGWGVLYWTAEVYFTNHIIDGSNPAVYV